MNEYANELRQAADSGDYGRGDFLRRAADEIDRLTAECEKLKDNWLTEQKERLDQFDFVALYDAAKAKVEIDRLTSALDAREGVVASHADVRRLTEWIESTPRKPPELAFTAGPERELATAIHSSQSNLLRVLQEMPDPDIDRLAFCDWCCQRAAALEPTP